MALNPAFDPPSRQKLPFAVGYVYGQGTTVLSTVAVDGAQIILNLLGECEWDGVALANSLATAAGSGASAHPAVPSHLVRKFANDTRGADAWRGDLASIMHFHSGSYGIKGAGNQMTSQGPDQGFDEWFADFPVFTPPQCFSGIAYAIWRAPLVGGISLKLGWGELSGVTGAAIWRTTRCRIFDAYGNVIGYRFTCNPAWQKVEAILRYKIKPQQPPLAGLTAAEKACFNWESIAELAARNDFILPNGNPRFIGNHIWAADATLTPILEALMRDDRSFIREQNGQIYMIGNDARASVFLCSANHLVEGTTFKKTKKDMSAAPNVFVPQFRDLGIPAVSEVTSATQVGPGEPITFRLASPNPFLPYGVFTYGGGTPGNLDGDYNVGNYVQTATSPPDITPGQFPVGTYSGPTTGGYVGSNDARFSQRAPRTVQHRSAQRKTRQQAPGLAVQPRIIPVFYDCGASTYDQTNRLMKFERDSTLGTDTGADWKAPITGALTCYLESVDANSFPLLKAGVHDVITLDDWVFPELPTASRDFEIMEIPTLLAPAGDNLGSLTFQLRQYNRAAPTDVSDPPGDSYQNVPNDGLQLSGFVGAENPAWVLQATPVATVALDTTLTITIPDLSVQVMGQASPTAYPGASWAEIVPGDPYLLYVTDATGIGTSPTFTVVPGVTPWVSPPAGTMLLFAGTFAMSVGGGAGPAPAVYSPTFPLVV